jgi:trans-2,3-dihydro-3-hydroxyanthranilate isomerase
LCSDVQIDTWGIAVERWAFEILDVFTNRPLAGNQLAVFADADGIPAALLQPLAREIGFAETVFVYPPAAGTDATVRIFTPENELPFAGHPTLGTAVVVANRLGKEHVVLGTGRGPVPVRLDPAAGPVRRGTMEQPLPTFAPFPEPEAYLAALGVERSVLPVTIYDNGIPHVYAMLERIEEVAALQPDHGALARLARGAGQAIIGCNVFAGAGLNWKTRMFAPADGIAEDPATGSAAGPLAFHLARHGLIPWEAEICIAQGAEIGRPSELFARVSGTADQATRIEVGGHAVQVGGGWFDGELLRALVS